MTPENQFLSSDETNEIRASLLKAGHSVELKLGGNSMFPYLRSGDIGTLTRIEPGSLQLGQVIVFQDNDRWVAHRLAAINHQGKELQFVTQGDSCIRSDRPFSEVEYLGVIQVISRRGKQIPTMENVSSVSTKMLLHLRPIPQTIIHFLLRLRNRISRN